MYIPQLQGATTFNTSDGVRLSVEPADLVWEWINECWEWIRNAAISFWEYIVKVASVCWEWIRDRAVVCKDFIILAIHWFIGHVILPANATLLDHPYHTLAISLLVCIGPHILLVPLVLLQGLFYVVLTALGFGFMGIVGGSPAALFQAFCYGANTPASSVFAFLQATGMGYHAITMCNWLLLAIRIVAALIAIYVLYSIL